MGAYRTWILAMVVVVGAPAGAAWAANPGDFAYPSDSTVTWDPVRLGAGETLESRFGEAWPDIARFNRMDRRHAWPGTRIRLPRRLTDVASFQPLPAFVVEAESLARFLLLDLSEQFLGAYEHGALAFSIPATSGRAGFATPTGAFTIDFADPRHASSKYPIEGTNIPYPMDWALRFHRSRGGVSYWIHARDLPGYPASHGCVGLVCEPMQRRMYGVPRTPVVDDARRLYAWAGGLERAGDIAPVRLRIVGSAPRPSTRPRAPVIAARP